MALTPNTSYEVEEVVDEVISARVNAGIAVIVNFLGVEVLLVVKEIPLPAAISRASDPVACRVSCPVTCIGLK